MANNPSKPRRRFRRRAGKALLFLVVILFLVFPLTNFLSPDRAANADLWPDTDQTRTEELIQLRHTFGAELRQGFGRGASWRSVATLGQLPASSIQHRASSSQHRASSSQHRASSSQHRASSSQHPVFQP